MLAGRRRALRGLTAVTVRHNAGFWITGNAAVERSADHGAGAPGPAGLARIGRSRSVRTDLPQPALQEVPLGGVPRALDGRPVRARRLGIAAKPAQQVGADGMKQVKAF